MNRTSLLFSLIVLIGGLPGCGDDDISADSGAPDMTADSGPGDAGPEDGGPEDAGPDARVPCDAVEAFEEGGAGHADPLGSAAGEARAGRLPAGALPDDPTDLLTWEDNDWVIANDRIAIVIEDVGVSEGYDPWGGKIVGLARVEGGALIEPADYNEVLLGSGRYTSDVTSITVLNDGSDGEAAVIRAIGMMHPLPFADEFGGALFPDNYDNVELAIDYILEPDAEQLNIRYNYRNLSTTPVAMSRVVVLAFQKERMRAFAPDVGFNPEGTIPYIGFAEEGTTSYAVESPLGELALLLELAGTSVLQGGRVRIEACAVTSADYARYTIGDGSNGVQAAYARANGQAMRSLAGRVVDANGAGAPGVRVHAFNGDIYHGRVMSGADGSFDLQIPTGIAPRVATWRRGDEIVTMNVGAEESDIELQLGASGTLIVHATEGGANVPVRVQVREVSGAAPAPSASWGEQTVPAGRMHIVFPGVEDARIRVPAGDVRVTVSRGFEYELSNQVVTVSAGAEVTHEVEMQRVVNTPNVMCADYHIHTNRSPDAPDAPDFKVRSAAGDGLEIPLRSDHDWVYEWTSIIEDENLDDHLFGITSLELTTFEYGHFGVFPMVPDPSARNRGMVEWAGVTPPDVFENVRNLASAPSLIINHPRGTAISGYFSAAGYDPETGMVRNPEMWDEAFSLVEVFNDSSFDTNSGEGGTVADWFSFLNQGRRVFAVGSSDSHKVQRGAPVGYPRTCLDLGVDTAADLRAGGGAEMVQERSVNGQFFVSGGIYIDVEARDGSVRPGGTVTSATAMEIVTVDIQAASWIDVDTAELWVDGEMVSSVSVGAGDGSDGGDPGVQRESLEFNVPVAASGSWMIVHVKGDLPLDPVYFARTPFAVSMPIFFER